MIETRRRFRFAVILIHIANLFRFCPPIYRWTFMRALFRSKSQYRINRGPWQNYKSAPQHLAVQLFAGKCIDA